MATCPHCGSQIEDSAKFCTFCGEKVAQPAAPAAEQFSTIPQDDELREQPAPQIEEPASTADPGAAFAQPVYPTKKKKSKKWLIPVIILAVLALFAIGALVLRGLVGRVTDDPNLGNYKATSVSMYGLDLDPDDIFEGGFVMEFLPGGICKIQAGDTKGTGTWKIENNVITVNDGSSTIEGKLEDGVITIENMLDMGLDITLVKLEDE